MSYADALRVSWRTSDWKAYVTAFFLTAATLILGELLGLGGESGESAQMIFAVPIIITAYRGGLFPGLLATILSAIAVNYFILPPLHSFKIRSELEAVEWVVLLLVGILVSALSETLLRSRHREAQARLLQEVTLASIGDAVITTDESGHVRFLNAVAERLTGWASAKAVGQPLAHVFRIIDEVTQRPIDDQVNRVRKEGAALELPKGALLIARDGTRIPVSDTVAPIRLGNEPMRGVVVVFRDASVERATENSLQERLALQEQLSRVVATSPGVLYTFQRHADGTACIPFASARMRDILGLEPEALAHSVAPLFAMMDAVDAVRVQLSIAESAQTLTDWHDAFRITRADGRTLWLEGHSIPTREADGGTTWHGYLNDVSHRHHVESALQSAEATLRLLLEQAPVSIAMFDTNMTYLACSGRWLREYGRGYEQLIGRNHYDVNPDLPDKWRQTHQAGLAGQSLLMDEDFWVQGDGSRHWLRWAVHPWRNGAGDVGGLIMFVEDITPRMLSEEALQASERRNRSLVETSPDAILLTRQRRVAYANAAAVTLFGAQSPDELVGLDIEQLVHADDRAIVQQEIQSIGAGSPAPLIRHRILRMNGTVAEVEANVALVADGEQEALQLVLRDITERRRHELAIEEREARLSGVINSAMDGIVTIDAEQRIVLANPAAERIFGRSAGDLLGQPVSTLIPHRFRADHVGLVNHFMKTGETSRRMHALTALVGLRAQGEEFPIEASISMVNLGGVHLSTIILRDISERQRTEQALKSSDERFHRLAESIHEVFWLTDTDTLAVHYVSPAYETIWGRSAEQLYKVPGDWIDAIYELDRARVVTARQKTLAMGTYDEEFRIVRPDGSLRWIRDRAFPVSEVDGKVQRVAGVAEDITERRQLEEQLRQSQKLESVGMLAGGVAHDFNNWLTVIAANSELLQDSIAGNTDGLDLLNEIRKAGERAATLTRQLLAFSRQQVLEPRVVDLNASVLDTEKLLQRLIGEDVVLTTVLRPVSLVLVDPGHLVQVLMNLAVNARDAMPKGGKLVVETSDLTVDEMNAQKYEHAKSGRYVRLTITDTGCGMSPEVRSHVFEPFFTTKGVGRGTGLGLSVVHGIVAQSGGFINLYSEVGVGTSFNIILPTAERTVTSSGSAPVVKALFGNETILLVEDEESVRKVATRALRAAGYTVLDAADGADALRALAQHHGTVELLLTDVVMPVMSGHELATAVQRILPHIQVLFASGYTDDAVVRHGIQHAEVAFLQKPYDVHALMSKVREVLDWSVELADSD